MVQDPAPSRSCSLTPFRLIVQSESFSCQLRSDSSTQKHTLTNLAVLPHLRSKAHLVVRLPPARAHLTIDQGYSGPLLVVQPLELLFECFDFSLS